MCFTIYFISIVTVFYLVNEGERRNTAVSSLQTPARVFSENGLPFCPCTFELARFVRLTKWSEKNTVTSHTACSMFARNFPHCTHGVKRTPSFAGKTERAILKGYDVHEIGLCLFKFLFLTRLKKGRQAQRQRPQQTHNNTDAGANDTRRNESGGKVKLGKMCAK